jgi:hypothetical protein
MIQEICVELLQSFSAQTPQRDVTDMGEQMEPHYSLVSVKGAGFEI